MKLCQNSIETNFVLREKVTKKTLVIMLIISLICLIDGSKVKMFMKNIDRLKEIILLERFYDTVSEELRVWLLDKNPLTLKDVGKLADEYTIIHKVYTSQKTYYRTAMRVEVTNSDKKGNKYFGSKT